MRRRLRAAREAQGHHAVRIRLDCQVLARRHLAQHAREEVPERVGDVARVAHAPRVFDALAPHAYRALGQRRLNLGQQPVEQRPELDGLGARHAEPRELDHVLEQPVDPCDAFVGERRETLAQRRVVHELGQVVGERLDGDEGVAHLVRELGEEQLELGGVRRRGRRERVHGCRGCGLTAERQVLRADRVAPGDEPGAGERHLELGDIPRPRVRRQAGERVRRQPGRGPTRAARERAQQALGDRRQLGQPCVERRHGEHDGREPGRE